MKRKLYNALIEWKNDPDRKPLVLEGADVTEGRFFCIDRSHES